TRATEGAGKCTPLVWNHSPPPNCCWGSTIMAHLCRFIIQAALLIAVFMQTAQAEEGRIFWGRGPGRLEMPSDSSS
ncbi:hypothetical protein V5799_003285, partial [Amblyomma americanum]